METSDHSPDGAWCYPPTPKRVWHRVFGEGRMLAACALEDGTTELCVRFYWRGHKHLLEPFARLVWLDEP